MNFNKYLTKIVVWSQFNYDLTIGVTSKSKSVLIDTVMEKSRFNDGIFSSNCPNCTYQICFSTLKCIFCKKPLNTYQTYSNNTLAALFRWLIPNERELLKSDYRRTIKKKTKQNVQGTRTYSIDTCWGQPWCKVTKLDGWVLRLFHSILYGELTFGVKARL